MGCLVMIAGILLIFQYDPIYVGYALLLAGLFSGGSRE